MTFPASLTRTRHERAEPVPFPAKASRPNSDGHDAGHSPQFPAHTAGFCELTPIRSSDVCLPGVRGACRGGSTVKPIGLGVAGVATGLPSIATAAGRCRTRRRRRVRLEGADRFAGGRVAPSTSRLPFAFRTQAQTSAVGSISSFTFFADSAGGAPRRRRLVVASLAASVPLRAASVDGALAALRALRGALLRRRLAPFSPPPVRRRRSRRSGHRDDHRPPRSGQARPRCRRPDVCAGGAAPRRLRELVRAKGEVGAPPEPVVPRCRRYSSTNGSGATPTNWAYLRMNERA